MVNKVVFKSNGTFFQSDEKFLKETEEFFKAKKKYRNAVLERTGETYITMEMMEEISKTVIVSHMYCKSPLINFKKHGIDSKTSYGLNIEVKNTNKSRGTFNDMTHEKCDEFSNSDMMLTLAMFDGVDLKSLIEVRGSKKLSDHMHQKLERIPSRSRKTFSIGKSTILNELDGRLVYT